MYVYIYIYRTKGGFVKGGIAICVLLSYHCC